VLHPQFPFFAEVQLSEENRMTGQASSALVADAARTRPQHRDAWQPEARRVNSLQPGIGVPTSRAGGQTNCRHFQLRHFAKRALLALASALSCISFANATQFNINGPAGSGSFGSTVRVLPNGHIVVVDPDWQNGTGAVYRFNENRTLKSTLRGDSPGDRVGSGGITILTNGHFVVSSPQWDNDTTVDVGAATWVSGTANTPIIGGTITVVGASNSLVGSSLNDRFGEDVAILRNGNYVALSEIWNNAGAADAGAVAFGNGMGGTVGVVSASNSLVGSATDDRVGDRVFALANGNYVVRSVSWNSGSVIDVGAVTFGNGVTGVAGVISSANSLIGTTAGDEVGSFGVVELGNGHYVVASPGWDNGAASNVGAVTWANGLIGLAGVVSSANSLIGNSPGDGTGSVTALSNGHYVVASPGWNNGAISNAGAVTWCNGGIGRVGVVTAGNSLIGSSADDYVGDVTALTNGNYVVMSSGWNNGAVIDAGAITWANGNNGTVGTVGVSNSLVGASLNDQIGSHGITVLGNGNYVAGSGLWDNTATGATDAGAATWGNGSTGSVGVLSSSNSLVGSSNEDNIGASISALVNGHYVVQSSAWDHGAIANAGAATWGNGNTGVSGAVSASNSLIGNSPGAFVGTGVAALHNGNYVVTSSSWGDGAVPAMGAVTWCNGNTGKVGVVSTANSLTGSSANDQVGSGGVVPLANGNYAVASPSWNNGVVTDVGAVTWGNGATGTVGLVGPGNSIIGNTSNDRTGNVFALTDGNYVVRSPQWDNAALVNAGATTFANGTSPTAATINASNSVLGTTATSVGAVTSIAYDATRRRLVVGRPQSNVVSLYDDSVFINDFEIPGLVPL
jgi:hypothetical protein